MSRRTVYTLLALGFLAFAAYGSLVPFHLRLLSLDEALARFRQADFTPLRHASRTDFVANVLLFLPVGVFLTAALADRSRGLALLALPLVVPALAGMSLLIEFSQVFAGSRTPSWNDVIAETLGGTVGALLWMVAGPPASDWVAGAARAKDPADRAARALGVYTAIWFIVGTLPFDFTLRLPELAEKYRAGRVALVPFARGLGPAVLLKFASTALWAAPVGAMAVLLAGPRAGLGIGLLGGFAAVAALEAAQVFAWSRWADVTDVVAGCAGAALGALAARGWLRSSSASSSRAGGPVAFRLWPLVALLGWFVVLAVRHWEPFDFVLDPEFVKSRLVAFRRVPFHNYYWTMPLAAFAEALTKIALGAPVGALLQLAWPARGGPAWGTAQAVLLLTIAAAIFTAVEVGQLLLPSRYPDLTDVALALAGAMAGLIAVRLAVSPAAGRRAG